MKKKREMVSWVPVVPLVPLVQVTLVSGKRRWVYGRWDEPWTKLEWRVVARRLVIVILKEIFGVEQQMKGCL
jgi:hypothetical protein